jgi:nicotinate phosphoribosyltransferase
VYKLVEICGEPRMKLSEDIAKVLIPGKKTPYRLYGKDKRPILDIMLSQTAPPPKPGERILCRHPFDDRRRVYVTPSRVESIQVLVFDQGRPVPGANRTNEEATGAIMDQLQHFRPDILRYINPTPYKVSVSAEVFDDLHQLWQTYTPVSELS